MWCECDPEVGKEILIKSLIFWAVSVDAVIVEIETAGQWILNWAVADVFTHFVFVESFYVSFHHIRWDWNEPSTVAKE